MHPEGKDFLKSTTDRLEEFLAILTPEDQHDLLDALAGEIGGHYFAFLNRSRQKSESTDKG
jgi:hypothetical protein